MNYLLIYLITINALGLLFMRWDKQKAKRGAWRIPETTLLCIAAAGGSAGCLAGMLLFRHKTRHIKFTVGLPLLLIANFIALASLIPLLG